MKTPRSGFQISSRRGSEADGAAFPTVSASRPPRSRSVAAGRRPCAFQRFLAVWLCLSAGSFAAEVKNANSSPRATNSPQAQASQWLATNMVAAGRDRGGTLTRRALLIGINEYEPTTDEMKKFLIASKASASKKKPARSFFQNLDGCVGDAEEMRAVLIARFGFKPADILVLTNRAATRDAILSAIRTHLTAASGPGDTALFFYAGHGSQVVNSKSDEADKRDETIVPVDSWSGAPDIRDKELRPLFNAILDKGIMLTAIFDSCHSGSAARGVPRSVKSRRADMILEDIADGTNYGAGPEEHGALVMAAVQDDQLADEQREQGVAHGVFTAALLKVLRLKPVGTSATDIFLATRSTMQAAGSSQEPVLAGIPTRRRMALFGGDSDGLSGRTAVAIGGINTDGEITLQGGRAVGLNEGCQLVRSAAETNKTAARLAITSLIDLTLAKAKVLEGRPEDLAIGDIFEVDRWTMRPDAMLRVWLPPAMDADRFDSALQMAAELRRSDVVDWVEDPTSVTPSHVLAWDGSRWILTSTNREAVPLEEKISAAQWRRIFSNNVARPKVFVSLPLSAALKNELKPGAGTENVAIEVVNSPVEANYLLVGAIRDGKAAYSWVLPNTSEQQAANLPLPARTDWFATRGQTDSSARTIATQLQDAAMRIGRVKAWLNLESPGDNGEFPYRLVLSNATTGARITGDAVREQRSRDSGQKQLCGEVPVVKGRDTLSLSLYADAGNLKFGSSQRLVYVFALDSSGRSQLLWPRRGQGNSQRFPPPPIGDAGYVQDIPLGRTFSVGAPYGIDTYILLTSSTAIPDESALEFDGVRAARGQTSDPLQRLIDSVNSPTRGVSMEAPSHWSIERISVHSVPP